MTARVLFTKQRQPQRFTYAGSCLSGWTWKHSALSREACFCCDREMKESRVDGAPEDAFGDSAENDREPSGKHAHAGTRGKLKSLKASLVRILKNLKAFGHQRGSRVQVSMRCGQ